MEDKSLIFVYEIIVLQLINLKVSLVNKLVLKLHCPKNEQNIRQNSALLNEIVVFQLFTA